MNSSVGVEHEISDSPPPIRLLTVNTHKGFTAFRRRFVLQELREAVRAVDADLVFLQEVQGAQRPAGSGHPVPLPEPHYEYLADRIWPQFAYGRNAVYPNGHHGNAMLSKYPIVAHQNHDVSVDPRGEARGLLHCVLQVPGVRGPLHAICVHLGLAERHRRRQLELLCHLLARQVPETAPLLLAGDFNDWRNRANLVLDRCAGLQEVFVRAFGRPARTFPARLPLLQLDRVYVRGLSSCRPVLLPRRPWSHLSDHIPLAADFTL